MFRFKTQDAHDSKNFHHFRDAALQLQQFVLEWERGYSNRISDYNDRHRGFDLVFREMRSRFTAPLVVETGCIRCSEDWRGAGYATYLFGAFVERFGGEVISVDIDSRHCGFAKQTTKELHAVTITNQDSVAYLRQLDRPIDILILDSMDTEIAGHDEHALAEIKAAQNNLHDLSIVILDDTVYKAGSFAGKGRLAVPWLLQRGWKILHSGYQTICDRERRNS